MIDEQIRVEFLEPTRWGRLGEILSLLNPAPRILYALEGGQTAYTLEGRSVCLRRDAAGQTDAQAALQEAGCDELQVWPAERIAPWYARMQAACTAEMSIEEYVRLLREDLPCRRYLRGGARLRKPAEVLTRAPAPDCAQAVLVTRGDTLYFDAVMVWRGGRLTLLSTLDRYDVVSDGPLDLMDIRDKMVREFGVEATVKKIPLNALR